MGRERNRELEVRVSYCQRKELTLKMDRRVTLASEHNSMCSRLLPPKVDFSDIW